MLDLNETHYIFNNEWYPCWGFVKLLYETGDSIQYFKATSFNDIQKLHPKYGNGKLLEPYSDEIREFHKWLEFESIELCNNEKNFLKEHLIPVEGNLDEFPFAYKLPHDYLAWIPENKREFNLYKLKDILD